MKRLLLWLEGPLQSWGNESRFDRRDTLFFPTRSAITGIALSAMGRKGEQEDLLLRLANESSIETVLCFRRKETKDIAILEDLHMIGGGYNDTDGWQNLCMPKKLDGSKPVGTLTRMTYRYYLLDKAFAVIWSLPEDLCEEISSSLLSPKYDLYLGRKACVPSEFVFQGVYDSCEKAKKKAAELAEEKNYILEKEVEEGSSPERGEVYMLYDVPVRFGKFKKYRPRYVTVIPSAGEKDA